MHLAIASLFGNDFADKRFPNVAIGVKYYFCVLALFFSSISQGLIAQELGDSTGYAYIQGIHVVGNEKTKLNIITRELTFQAGDFIAWQDLEDVLTKSRNNVYNTNLFNTVEIQKLPITADTLDIFIKLEERWYVWPGFVLRPVDRNFIDWWKNRDRDLTRVRLGPKLNIYNVRGRDETMNLIALFGFDRRLILQYSFPYIDKQQKHGLTLGGGYVTKKRMPFETVNHINNFIAKDSTYLTEDSTFLAEQVNSKAITFYATYRYRPSFYDYHYITLQAYGIEISDDVAELNPNYFGNGATTQNVIGLSYSNVRDKRNNRNYPLKGYYWFGEIEKMGLGIFNDLDIWRTDLQFQIYKDLGKGWYLSNSLGTQITSQNAPYFNYTSFGEGTYYVRGFERYLVEGPINVLTRNSIRKQVLNTRFNLENKMPIKKFRNIPFAIYAKAFTDAGYVANYPNYSQNSRLTNKAHWSLGVGVDLVMLYDVTLRLEYSFNSENQFRFAPNVRSEL